MKKLSYLLVASVLLGAQFLAIPLGFAQLSAYRSILFLSVMILVYKVVIKDPNLKLSFGHEGDISPYQLFFIVWLIYGGLSVIWAESITRWIAGIFFVGTGVYSILFISYFLREAADIKKAFGIFLVMTGFHHILGWKQIIVDNIGFPRTTFANQNDFATLLLAGFFVALMFLIDTKKISFKFLLMIYLISSTALIVITTSRGNLLALFVGIVIFAVIKLLDYDILRVGFVLMLGAVLIFLGALVISPAFRDLFSSFLEWLLAGPFQPNRSNRYRINLLLNGFYFLLKSFGLGVGAGNIEHHMTTDAILVVDAPNIHNWFMDILVGYGVIIFALYVMMYVFILRRLYLNYSYSNDSFIKNGSFILFSYLIAFLVSSTSSSSNIVIEWQWIFWGLIIAFVQYTERVAKKKEHILQQPFSDKGLEVEGEPQ